MSPALPSQGGWLRKQRLLDPGTKRRQIGQHSGQGRGLRKGGHSAGNTGPLFPHIPLSLYTLSSLRRAHCLNRHSLGCQLDELPEQLSPGPRNGAETELGGHPVLQLIEAAHEALQVCGGDIPQVLGTQHVMDQLHLDGAEVWSAC